MLVLFAVVLTPTEILDLCGTVSQVLQFFLINHFPLRLIVLEAKGNDIFN